MLAGPMTEDCVEGIAVALGVVLTWFVSAAGDAFGRAMNLDPSLFAYLDTFLPSGESGAFDAGEGLFAGISGQLSGMRHGETSARLGHRRASRRAGSAGEGVVVMVRALDNLLSWQYFGCPGGRDPSPRKGRARIVEGVVAASCGLKGADGFAGRKGGGCWVAQMSGPTLKAGSEVR